MLGALISSASGFTTAHALQGIEPRGTLFVGPNVKVYPGMVHTLFYLLYLIYSILTTLNFILLTLSSILTTLNFIPLILLTLSSTYFF